MSVNHLDIPQWSVYIEVMRGNVQYKALKQGFVHKEYFPHSHQRRPYILLLHMEGKNQSRLKDKIFLRLKISSFSLIISFLLKGLGSSSGWVVLYNFVFVFCPSS